ncbi:MAG: CpsD/CapB family tyrosine-protein kinase [Solobacterium sp.]|nr:CpsD/CapB family tyrosine-protein kinase [Solobacterium sp.]
MKQLYLENLPELPFNVTEALNQLRISLGFSGENIQTVMVTSSTPNEGKSFVTMELWKMMAEIGSRTALIDCDMRNSVMGDTVGFRTNDDLVGIVHYLAGKADLKDIVYATNIPNAYLIPVSTNVPNPTVLLEGKRFQEIIDVCKEEFDFVLIDTPPLGSVADALNIAPKTDGSLLVIRSGETPKKVVENSINLLRRTGAPLLGVVLNRADTSKNGNQYYYNRYYQYGYYNNESYYGKK